MSEEATVRDIKEYEYRVKCTPEYCYPIDEDWTLIDVFLKRLEIGYRNYVLVFRREVKKEQNK